MSVANFDGDGYGDTSGLVYGYETDETDDKEIRKVVRSGYGHLGVSPGDVQPMSSTRSTLDDRLPKQSLPGDPGYKQDDCGDDIPAFACEDCGNPVYVGRTCASPVCERCWPSAVKSKTITAAGKLEGMRRDLYVNHYNERKQVDFNHVVASLPDLLVDSEEPIEHALKILKVLLEKKFGLKGFLAIFHPYRIKDEYRKDQYEHGGAQGQGDMTWKDVLNSENPYQYLKFEPHFHIFFAARRYAFDYSVTEAVERETGWVFHRIEKEDSSISVLDYEDLVHQLCYCFSHAGVTEGDERNELTSRMKGNLHNIYIPTGAREQATAAFCDAAPKLLGIRFRNTQDASCEAEGCDCDGECHCEDDHPLHELYDEWDDGTNRLTGSAASSSAAPSFDESSPPPQSANQGSSGGSNTSTTSTSGQPRSVTTPIVADGGQACGGDLVPIRKAEGLLEDDEWCDQARYSEALRLAYDEWTDRTDGGDDDLDLAKATMQTH